jgi:succinoglycan biosynthesis transport protein ExoP
VNLLESLRRGWRYLLLVAIPVIAGVAFYSQSLANQYTATGVVSFAPRANENVGADVVSIVVPKYQVYATSDAVVARAARSLDVPKTEISDHLNASIPVNTSNLEISVDGTSPTFAANAADKLVAATQVFSRSDDLLEGTIVSNPVVPTSPSGPNRHLIDLAGLVVGLLLGCVAALMVERVRPVIESMRDVEDATELAVVGVVPRSVAVQPKASFFTRRKPQMTAGRLADALDDDREVGTAVGNLRTKLDRAGLAQVDDGARSLVVTSALPSEGKTTIAALLAIASSRIDQEVLLIDGDLVRPSVGRMFNVSSRVGVAQVLRGGASGVRNPEEACKSVLPRLHVMPTIRESDAGALISQNMGRLLNWASHNFDLVILDAPPVFGNDSGQQLACQADATLVVVAKGTRWSVAREAVATLRSLDVRVVGAVGNELAATHAYAYYA